MSDRIPFIAASTAAALTLLVAIAAAGFAPTAPEATTVSSPATIEPAAAEPTVQVDTIYLAPPPAPETITVQQVIKTSNGEADEAGEASGGDD